MHQRLDNMLFTRSLETQAAAMPCMWLPVCCQTAKTCTKNWMTCCQHNVAGLETISLACAQIACNQVFKVLCRSAD
jgi:hypothetical protein